jgi:hypothetical protein
MLVCYHAHNKLFQIPTTVFWVAESDFDRGLAIIALILSVDAEARGIDMKKMGGGGELLHTNGKWSSDRVLNFIAGALSSGFAMGRLCEDKNVSGSKPYLRDVGF